MEEKIEGSCNTKSDKKKKKKKKSRVLVLDYLRMREHWPSSKPCSMYKCIVLISLFHLHVWLLDGQLD